MSIVFILNIFSYLLYLIGFRGISILSTIFGVIFFDVLRIRRKIILQNIDIALAETKTSQEKIMIARKSCINFICTSLELLAHQKLFKKAKYVIDGKEIVDEIYARKQGLYAICIHMSNWEFLCYVCYLFWNRVSIVVKPIGKGKQAQWFEEKRKAHGVELINRKGPVTATAQIEHIIKNNGIVGFIVDQKRPRGEFLPFFGKMASTNNSLPRLYMQKNAPLVPVSIKRTGLGEFSVKIYPEFKFEIEDPLSFREKISNMTLQINKQVEVMIRENPEEYFWMHNRWNLS